MWPSGNSKNSKIKVHGFTPSNNTEGAQNITWPWPHPL